MGHISRSLRAFSSTSMSHRQLARHSILPQIYSEEHSAWRDLRSVPHREDSRQSLPRNSLLKIVSWNIDFASPAPAERAAAALEHLQATFGDDPARLAIVLQEVCQVSVQRILQSRWVRRNFVVTGQEPPRVVQAGIPRPARYFTLAITPRLLGIEKAFRMPLPSEMGRDALFVDILLYASNDNPNAGTKDVLRLCTTHLESLNEGRSLRERQLALISQTLIEDSHETNVVAGLIGGDMNALRESEHALPKQAGLRDAWEDEAVAHPPDPNGGKGSPPYAYGRASGHTWGYQSKASRWMPKRLDKFLYKGQMKTVPLTEVQGFGTKVGRLGIGLRANVPLEKAYPEQQV